MFFRVTITRTETLKQGFRYALGTSVFRIASNRTPIYKTKIPEADCRPLRLTGHTARAYSKAREK